MCVGGNGASPGVRGELGVHGMSRGAWGTTPGGCRVELGAQRLLPGGVLGCAAPSGPQPTLGLSRDPDTSSGVQRGAGSRSITRRGPGTRRTSGGFVGVAGRDRTGASVQSGIVCPEEPGLCSAIVRPRCTGPDFIKASIILRAGC